MRRPLPLLALAVLLISAAPPAPDLTARARAVLARTSGTIRVPGLQRPVTVLRGARDPRGLPQRPGGVRHDLQGGPGGAAGEPRRRSRLEAGGRAAPGRAAAPARSPAARRPRRGRREGPGPPRRHGRPLRFQ